MALPNAEAAARSDSAFSFSGTAELWANEKFLPRYNADIVTKLSSPVKNAARVLEFGGGIGTLAQLWEAHTGVKPECLEIDPGLEQVLTERGFKTFSNLHAVQGPYDVVYTSNTLEHVEDDVEAMRQIHARLKPGGVLAIYVPAFMCLYSSLDAAVGHYRRYEKAELINKLHCANFTIQTCEYADFLGFFTWLYLKWRRQDSGATMGGGKALFIYDRFIFPVSRLLDRLGARFLMGKNLFVIARKQG